MEVPFGASSVSFARRLLAEQGVVESGPSCGLEGVLPGRFIADDQRRALALFVDDALIRRSRNAATGRGCMCTYTCTCSPSVARGLRRGGVWRASFAATEGFGGGRAGR